MRKQSGVINTQNAQNTQSTHIKMAACLLHAAIKNQAIYKLFISYLQHIVIKNPAITKHAAIKRLNAPIPGIGKAGFK